MAKKFGKVSIGEKAVDPEPETAAVRAPEVPGGTPPTKVARSTRFGPSGDGGRREWSVSLGGGFVARTMQFLRDVRAEMRRVSWPTVNDVKNTTIITLIAVVFFAVYLFLVDRVWAFVIDHLRTWLGG